MKRFTDTEKWADQWFRTLPPKIKLFWLYLVDRCDMAGVWKPDFELASFMIGEKITEHEASTALKGRLAIEQSGWFVPKFIKFQYGKLVETCPPHVRILRALELHKIPYPYPVASLGSTLEEEDKDKEEDKDRKEGDARGRFSKPTFPEMELHASKIGLPPTEINKFFDYYESNGWRVGKNPMKSWPSAMQNWKRHYEENRYGNKSNRGSLGENPRNVGIVKGPTNYTEAFRRKANASQKAPVAGPSDRPESLPPTIGGS